MYLELEKERNASTTAANEAMGMIARLQEEKAAMLMEAKQFQQVVEQKSMHNQEAIEGLREVIARIEEEKRELEEENEFSLQQKRGILRSKYHRKQQRKKFLKTHSCEPQFLANS